MFACFFVIRLCPYSNQASRLLSIFHAHLNEHDFKLLLDIDIVESIFILKLDLLKQIIHPTNKFQNSNNLWAG